MLRIESIEATLAAAGARGTWGTGGAASEQGLPIGTPAPIFALPRLDGTTKTLEDLRAAGKPVLLVFSDTGCGPCNAFMPELRHWRAQHADRVVISILNMGPPDENRAKAEENGLTDITLVQDSQVADLYQAYGTPAAVLVRPDGAIGSRVALGADAIRALFTQALTLQEPRSRSRPARLQRSTRQRRRASRASEVPLAVER